MSAPVPDDIYTSHPQSSSSGVQKSVLIVTADKVEDLEFFYPYYRFLEEGYKVDIATPKGGKFSGKHDIGLKDSLSLDSVTPESYDLLYVPGGKAPEALKKEDQAIAIVKSFASSGKTIASICHGPQLLAKAGVIQGKTISAYPEVQKELEEAGATFVSEECASSGQFITGRWPADLPAFTKKVIEALQSQAHSPTRYAA